MKKHIPMLDLKAEMADIGDELKEAMAVVLESTQFINGTVVKVLEEEMCNYLGVKHVVTCGNGTDALMIALMAAGLKPGDEVITTPFTFFATAEVISFLGLKVKFADIDEDSFNISPASANAQISDRSRAIMPVHLFGQAADMRALKEIADEHNLLLIEDSAQSTGGKLQMGGKTYHTGTISDVAGTSFFPSKNLACYGDGGAIFTDNDTIAETARMIKNHGSRVKYENEMIGVNSRLDSIQAAILRVKLQKLDEFNASRRRVAENYTEALQGMAEIAVPKVLQEAYHVYHQYTIKVKDGNRDELQAYLKEQGISSVVYYKKPLHLQEAFRKMGLKKGTFPNVEKVADQVLSLPIHPYLPEGDQSYIIESIKRYFQAN